MTTNLTVLATFTKSGGQPATALTLAEISLYLTSINKATGAVAVIWDGTQVPTVEVTNTGAYARILATADLNTYDYVLSAQYTGATVLDSNYAPGATGQAEAIVMQMAADTLTAAAIAVSALNGKGDWNVGKTGYSLTVTPPTAVQVRQEMDSNSTQLAAIAGKTTNLPADPADESAIEATITAATSPLATSASIAALNNLSAAQVWAYVTRTLTSASGPDAATIADAIWDELRSGHSTQGSYGESFFTLESGTAIAGTLTTSSMSTNLTEATNDHYNGRIVIWLTGALTRQASDITAYNGTTKVLSYSTVTEAPAVGDRFIIV